MASGESIPETGNVSGCASELALDLEKFSAGDARGVEVSIVIESDSGGRKELIYNRACCAVLDIDRITQSLATE